MNNKDFFLALDELEQTKKISKQVFLDALTTALVTAYKRNYGESMAIDVRINPEKASIKIIAYKTVVEEVVDPDKEMSLEEAQALKPSYKVGDVISREVVPKDFGRIAAQTAKQIINQRLREEENKRAYEELADKEDKLSVCVVRRVENNNVYVDMGRVEGVMLASDQIAGETYNPGDKIKVYVKHVAEGARGPRILVSRSSEHFVRKLFEQEVPEINAGIVVIKNIVREAGYRTKISVMSNDPQVDPVGACVGTKGSRVNAIIAELVGEKIDIIPWCEDSLEYIARALSPAKVNMVHVDYDKKSAIVIVADDKLSLAIGKGGQNARLAVKLTGWKIDVKSETASREMEIFRDVYGENEAEE